MTETQNPLGLKKIHHVEFYVGNPKRAEFYYRSDMQPVLYVIPSSGELKEVTRKYIESFWKKG